MIKAAWTFQELKELHRAVACLPEQPCLNCRRSLQRGQEQCEECSSGNFWLTDLADPFCVCLDVRAALRREVDGWLHGDSEPSREYLQRCELEKGKLVELLRAGLEEHEFGLVTSSLCMLQQFSVPTPEWYWSHLPGMPHREAFFFVGAYYSARGG